MECNICDGSGFCPVCPNNGQSYTNDDEHGNNCRCPEGPCCGHCHDNCKPKESLNADLKEVLKRLAEKKKEKKDVR